MVHLIKTPLEGEFFFSFKKVSVKLKKKRERRIASIARSRLEIVDFWNRVPIYFRKWFVNHFAHASRVCHVSSHAIH